MFNKIKKKFISRMSKKMTCNCTEEIAIRNNCCEPSNPENCTSSDPSCCESSDSKSSSEKNCC